MGMDRDKAALIASAELVTYLWDDGRTVSGHAQKAVLWTLWAFEGQRISVEAIGDRSCVSIGQAWRALWALIRQGIVVAAEPVSRQKCRAYAIDPRRLIQLRCATPLQRKRRRAPRRLAA